MPTKKTKKKSRLLKNKLSLSRWQMMIFIVLFGAIGGYAILQTFAAPSFKSPFAFVPGMTDGGRHIARPVDWLTWCGDCYATGSQLPIDFTTSTPWVTNPTKCMWDTDDWFEYTTNGGSLAAGVSASVNDCSYEYTSETYGPNPNIKKNSVIHAAVISLSAPVPNLTITTNFAWSGGSQSFSPTTVFNASTKKYEYKQCILIEGVKNGSWSLVPDSNGGYGVPVTITTTITNSTSRSVKDIYGKVQYGWQQFYRAGCTTASNIPPLGN